MILGGVLLTGILIGISYAKPGFSRELHDTLPQKADSLKAPAEPLSADVKIDPNPPASESTTSTESPRSSVNGISATLTPYVTGTEPITSKRPAATWGETSATVPESKQPETSTSTETSSSTVSSTAASSSAQTSSQPASSLSSTSTTTTSIVSPVLIAYGYDESDVIRTRAEYYEAAKKHIEAYIGNPIGFTTLVKGLPIVRQIETAYDNESYKEGYANDVVKDLKVKGLNVSVSSQYIGDDYYVISHSVVLGEKESSSSSSSK